MGALHLHLMLLSNWKHLGRQLLPGHGGKKTPQKGHLRSRCPPEKERLSGLQDRGACGISGEASALK